MTAVDLVNRTFEKYYHNLFIPSPIGGSPETAVVRLLMAIQLSVDIALRQAEITQRWIDTEVTWFTRDLPLLLGLPKFPNETDAQFLDRVRLFSEAQQLGGQSTHTLRKVIHSLIGDAVDNPETDIIILTSSQFNEWKDLLETADAYWSQENPADPPNFYLWAETSETFRSTIVIQIQFANSGSSSDPLNYEYWNLSTNYTKIQDVVKLFKAPGITFELELLSP